jgi:two-component system, sensor histidine kinase and response regulator
MPKRWYEFWSDWGLVPRLMLAVGFAVVAGGFMQSALLVVEGASDSNERLKRDVSEVLRYLAPVVADQALVGDYAAIEQTLKKQVNRSEIIRLWWTDPGGRVLSAEDKVPKSPAPGWFSKVISIEAPDGTEAEVSAGGVSYGKLQARMTTVHAETRLWQQFVKQLQIVAATLFLMLQFIWLIFRGNLGTLRDLAAGANRFSQGDHKVRIAAEGAPEVRLAADAFNNMATNTETLLTSLSQSESKNRLLASIVEQSSEAIWTTDLDGVVTSWNAGATTMFGYAADEAMGRARQLGGSNQAAEEERKQRLLRLEKFSYDTKANTKAGAQIDIQVAVAPLLGEDGKCVGRISVARDVTERNRSEEALRTARASAESANHAKSAFLARMSHEIRTPMNGVLGMTELLLETELTSTQRKYAETVHRSGNNLLGIINDVLDFSKIEAGKLELETVECDLRRTVEDVVDMLAERAHTKGLDLACSIPAGIPVRVMGDPLRVGQILTNLTGNAIKFTQKGSILISMSCVKEEGERVTMRFEVKDTGLGISREAQSRIFEEFSQADGSTTRQHGGSGLGLAISKQLVEMMGGSIHVESEPGVGSTFWFTAVFKKQPQTEHVSFNTIPMTTLRGVRALIVESNVLSRGILHGQVTGWGMVTRVAESPEHALVLLKQAASRGVPMDIAIMDLGFVGGDPLELARAIRHDPVISKIKLAMLAPVGNHAAIQEARSAGIDTCLVKPVRQSALYDALVNVMSGEAATVDPAAAQRAAASAVAGLERHGSVLLVEDNLVNQAVALGMLNKLLGYNNVVVANNGREAIEAWAKNPPDLILMDCHMPEVDGFQAAREIRKREVSSGRRVPIIALTANAMAQDREDCLRAGMDDHLGKPFSRKQIEDMLERWMPKQTAAGAKAAAPSQPVPQKTDSVLDRRVLNDLRDEYNEDDPDLLGRVIGLYVQESPNEMARLAQAVSSGDAAQIGRAAHSLKSSSANVGATLLSQQCAAREAAGRSGNLETARESYARLAAEHARVQLALKAELGALSKA